jgi:hypothetical protein
MKFLAMRPKATRSPSGREKMRVRQKISMETSIPSPSFNSKSDSGNANTSVYYDSERKGCSYGEPFL